MSRLAVPSESQEPLTAAHAGITPAMLRSPRRGLRRAGIALPAAAVALPYMVAVAYIGGFFKLSVETVGIMLAAGPVLAAIAYFVLIRRQDAALRREVLATALIAPGRIESIRANRGGSSGLIGSLESISGQQTRLGAINLTVAFSFTVRSGGPHHGEAIVSTAGARNWNEGDECVVVYDPQDPARNFLVVPNG